MINLKKKSYLGLLFILILSHFFSCLNAQEIIEPKFGPEFTFTNNNLRSDSGIHGGNIVRTPASSAALEDWLKEMESICMVKHCTITSTLDRYGLIIYHFTYPDGFQYTLTTDPAVIEINMIPLTIPQTIHYAQRIKEDIFGVAEKIKLYPNDNEGGGHIHMDKKTAFGDNSQLFMDFFIDYSNHFALGKSEGLGDDLAVYANASSLLELPPSSIIRLQEIAAKAYDNDGTDKKMTIEELSRRISREVYTSHYRGLNPAPKYQALNVERMKEKDETNRTLEIRGIRAQKNVEEYINMLRIFRARLNFLNLRRKYGLPRVELHLTKTYTSSIDHLYHYIKESGLIWPEFQQLQKIKNFDYFDEHTPLRRNPHCLSQKDKRIGQPQKMIEEFFQIRSKL